MVTLGVYCSIRMSSKAMSRVKAASSVQLSLTHLFRNILLFWGFIGNESVVAFSVLGVETFCLYYCAFFFLLFFFNLLMENVCGIRCWY